MISWLQSLDPGLQDVLSAIGRALIAILGVFAPVPFMIWFERRLLSWMQDRVGPNRTGNITFSRKSRLVPGFLKGKKIPLFGLLQSIADGLKLFTKEDIMPGKIDRTLFLIAPLIALFVALTLGATIPYGPFPKFTPVADVNIGLLYVLAISSLGAYGMVLAGYSSNNKYSLMGALRASAQLISYELAMAVSLACMVMVTGSLKLTDIVEQQNQPLWGVVPFLANWNILTPMGLVAGVVFFVCVIAETNRPPFDLPEAENELVAGYHTEYSTKRWGLFMMAEYMAMFTFSMVFFTVFMGGWRMLPIRLSGMGLEGLTALEGYAGPLVMFVKGAIGLTVYIWLRASFPRLRYDQLMNLGWKFLLPVAAANLIICATWIVVTKLGGTLAGWSVAIGCYLVLLGWWLLSQSRKRAAKQEMLPTRTVRRVRTVKSTELSGPAPEAGP